MKNKDLDKILTQLGDFDPQAKPNWEAFIADNESRINTNGKTPGNETGKGIFSNKTTRYAGAFMVAVTGLLIAWYFAGTPGDSAQSDERAHPHKTEIKSGQPEKADVPEINTNTEESIPTPVNESVQTIETEQNTESQPVKSETESAQPTESTPEIPVEDQKKPDNNKPEQDETVIITDTVYMKKTIHVTDSVKQK